MIKRIYKESLMDREIWEDEWERLIDQGWQLCRARRFRPLFGRYWEIEARYELSGRSHTVEAPTLKIAMKKLAKLVTEP
jgi:hypothetical protein